MYYLVLVLLFNEQYSVVMDVRERLLVFVLYSLIDLSGWLPAFDAPRFTHNLWI